MRISDWSSDVCSSDLWTDLSALWTPNAATIVRARLYHIDSRRDYRNAERYIYNETSGLIDRSDNAEIHHEQKQTGLTADAARSEEHTSELQSLMRISYAVFCSKKKQTNKTTPHIAI